MSKGLISNMTGGGGRELTRLASCAVYWNGKQTITLSDDIFNYRKIYFVNEYYRSSPKIAFSFDVPPYELVIGEEDTDYSNNTNYIRFKATRPSYHRVNSYIINIASFKYYKSLKRIVIGEASDYCSFGINANTDGTATSNIYILEV